MENQLNLYVLQLKHPYAKMAENVTVDVSTVRVTRDIVYLSIDIFLDVVVKENFHYYL